jgi:hypothetical protein
MLEGSSQAPISTASSAPKYIYHPFHLFRLRHPKVADARDLA